MDTAKVILLLISASLSVAQRGSYDPECEYKGDMANISVDNCIAKMEADDSVDWCYGIVDVPLYSQRDDTPFWIINITSDYRELHPNDLTYKILYKLSNTNQLKPIKDCESLKLDGMDYCILPKLESHETMWIYMPLQKGRFPYCYYEIEERIGVIEYCFGEEPDLPCYEFKDGRYFRRDPYVPVNTEFALPIPTELCFFPVPKDYLDVRRNWTKSRVEPSITREGTGNNISALLENKTVRCTIEVSNNSVEQRPVMLARDYRNKNSDFVCYFFRAPKWNKAWTTKATCLNVELVQDEPNNNYPDEGNANLVVILVVAFSLIVVLVVIVGALWLYKNHIVQCTFKKNREEAQKSLAINQDHLLDCDQERNISAQEKEIPFEITFESDVLKYPTKPQTNEEKREKLSNAHSETQALMCTDHMLLANADEETNAVAPELYIKFKCESGEELQTNTMIDNHSIHDMKDECVEVDHFCDYVISEGGHKSSNINSFSKGDIKERAEISMDSGYSSKHEEPPLYVSKAFGDYRQK